MGAVAVVEPPDQPPDPLGLPRNRPLTRDDLDAMPDDGHRYELIDGVLIVSPAPRRIHQRIVLNLARLLADACPPELEVFVAPFDVTLDDDTVLQPDLLVARRSDTTPADLPKAPLLAVEVLSPSTRGVDLTLKPYRLAKAGCPAYWTVDPDEAQLIARELQDGAYREVMSVTGDEVFRATRPFPVDVVPADLLL